jgi:hypothetical protein
VSLHPEEDFTPANVLDVSPSALAYAREFAEAIGSVQGGSKIVTFYWATSVSMQEGPDAPEKHLGSCVTLGPYRREEIPQESIRLTAGFEFAVKIPANVWMMSAEKLIDRDDARPFRLTLR